jgi:hypothetical protein
MADELVHALVWGSAEAISSVSVLVSGRSRLPYRASAAPAYRRVLHAVPPRMRVSHADCDALVGSRNGERCCALKALNKLQPRRCALCSVRRYTRSLYATFPSAAVHAIVGTYSLVLAVFTL